MPEWILWTSIIGGSLLVGFVLGWMVSRIPFGFAVGCLPALIAPPAIMMLIVGVHYGSFGAGLLGSIPCVAGCAAGFVAFRNPKTYSSI
jgi:hypothetical protein